MPFLSFHKNIISKLCERPHVVRGLLREEGEVLAWRRLTDLARSQNSDYAEKCQEVFCRLISSYVLRRYNPGSITPAIPVSLGKRSLPRNWTSREIVVEGSRTSVG